MGLDKCAKILKPKKSILYLITPKLFRCLVVSRATFVDEERQTSVETTPKTSNVDPPKIEAAVLQSKNQTAKKRKKKK